MRNNSERLLLPVRFLWTSPLPANPVRRAGHALTKPVRAGIGTTFLSATAALILIAALPGARSIGLLAVGYLLAAAAAELAGGASRREQPFQYGVILILFAALSGDGATAPLIALCILAVRFFQDRERRPALRRVGAAYVIAAAAAWATGSLLPHPQISLSAPSIWMLANAVAVTAAFLLTNAGLVSFLLALESGKISLLRLRQHRRQLIVRYTGYAVIVWAAYAGCELFLSIRGVPALLSTLVLLALGANRTYRRRLRARQQLYTLTEAAEQKDRATADHLRRVGEAAEAIAGELGLADVVVERIGLAGQLHDLGKVGVSASLLQFEGRLSETMRREMEQHSLLGEQLLRSLTAIPEAAAVAGGHHERWDGAGYPRHLAGKAIPLAARVTGVADSWDAMTSDRPYRAALSEEVAIGELRRHSGSQFDPDVVAAFERLHAQPTPRWSLLNACDTTPIVC
ncbi:MAG: HD-GYP domain-containing protein [Dehalococcoidia bacterium]